MTNSNDNNISQDSIKKLNEFSAFFEKYFCFSESEIKELIERVLSENDNNLVIGLLDLFEAFINQDIENFDPDERNLVAKRAINHAIDLYTTQKNKNFDEIIKILNHAKQFGTDPFKLIKKTVLKNATFDSYSNCIEALKNHVYTDKILNTEFSLIDENQNINEFLEDCSSIICKLSAENVQNVLDVLGEFFYDESIKKYIINPKDAVKQVKTLLITNPTKLEENINFYLSTFSNVVPENKIKYAIANCPSSLTFSQTTIREFMQQFKLSIDSLITLTHKNPKFSSQKISSNDLTRLFNCEIPLNDEDIKNNSKNYQAFLDTVTKRFCIENLSNIGNLGKNKISSIYDLKDIFIEPFGIKNALFCIQDFNFLNADKELLDYMFSLIMESEKAGHKNLREFILRHPSKSVKLAGELKSVTGDEHIKAIINGFEPEKDPKKQRQIFNLPKASSSVSDIATKRERLTESQIKTAKKLLDQIIESSRKSDDLDVELINKLSRVKENFMPVITMCQRAEIAFRHNDSTQSKNLALQVSKFNSDYSSYIASLTKLNKKYEECKKYYVGKAAVPKITIPLAFNFYTSSSLYSITDCHEKMEERADQTYNDNAAIEYFISKIENFYRNASRNPLSDKKYYEEPLTNLLGKDCFILKSEAATLSVINRLAEELNKIYPNKALEILGKENYLRYLDMPIPTTRLLSYILVVCRNNSHFLYEVRKLNNFQDIRLQDMQILKAKSPKDYNEILKLRKFEKAYLEIEKVLCQNFSSHGHPYDVSADYRLIERVNDGITFLCPKVDESYEFNDEVDIKILNSDSNEKDIPLSAKGIRKLLGKDEKILIDKNLEEETIEKVAKFLN